MTRRRYAEEQKLAVVREAVETGNCAVVGRRHGIAENLVSRDELRELALLRPQRKVKPKHPRRLARCREVTGPNQLWETDVKYGYVEGERWRRLTGYWMTNAYRCMSLRHMPRDTSR